jgi:hypothetical protein
MSGVFSKPKTPAPPKAIPLPVTPIVDDSQISREQADMLKRRRGRASTVLTDASTSLDESSVAGKNLLGM